VLVSEFFTLLCGNLNLIILLAHMDCHSNPRS
jgi:hypothetical protein